MALVTGATGGLGRGMAQALHARGWAVIVHGRDPVRIRGVTAVLPGSRGLIADLGALDDVLDLGRAAERGPGVDLLVNNAAVAGSTGGPQFTRDGVPTTYAVDYLAPALLTRLLLPGLLRRRGSVLDVVATTQRPLDHTEFERPLPDREAYARAKLSLVMDTRTLHARYHGAVRFLAVNPGSLLDTPMVRSLGLIPRAGAGWGCTALLAQVDRMRTTGASGEYIDVDHVAHPHPQAEDPATCRRLVLDTDRMLAPWLAAASGARRTDDVNAPRSEERING